MIVHRESIRYLNKKRLALAFAAFSVPLLVWGQTADVGGEDVPENRTSIDLWNGNLEAYGENLDIAGVDGGGESVPEIDLPMLESTGHSSAYVSQHGNRNSSYVSQWGLHNEVSVGQSGDNNHANVSQAGDGNELNLSQVGSGLVIGIRQRGVGAAASVRQSN